ncbi:sigma-70 family RNA polymerase sigma factor [Pedobacter sp. HMF7647]|uniref:Sigma-70 family RNA polymerase sigma factor n=1 Tax=Hufsiella arboris TaxID=2695275 RepID=A0A7K1Y691_9SPHI|nr:sigma-70 family RNA polymerase sigma factor [Hufsiella arboris]MXV49629.1 sigma-70 family RNA polymerase sigma factor [Hufsiella arboris]
MQIYRSDTELIEEVLAGKQQAYAELVGRHQRFVFTLAMRFTKSRESAEEIAQDCFVKAYRSLNSFQRTAKFSTWLYSIVYTTSMTYLRKKQLLTDSIDDETVSVELESYASPANGYAENRSRSFYVNKCIEMLLPDDSAIITMFYKGEQSLEEIGKALHMDPQTVKVKLHRARQRLKQKLEIMLKHEVKELL